MRKQWQQYRRVWYRVWHQPDLLIGWTGLIIVMGGLRWLGRTPGWTWEQVGLLVGLVGLAGWQLTRVGATLLNVSGTLNWQRRWGRTLGALAGLAVLALPWGFWGLSSRLLVRLPLPALWVNWVTLNRRPVLVGAAVIYLLILLSSLIWGPRLWRLTGDAHQGTPSQMIGGVCINCLGFAGWFGISWLIVAVNRWLDARLTVTQVTWLTGISLAGLLLGVTLVAIAGITVLVWCWCGQPQQPVPPVTKSHPHGWGVLVISWLVVNGAIIGQTLQQPNRFGPTVMISHRGVDHGWGVQNTLGALRHVHQEHPQYVEMDLHETRDHQFVVLHDENLQQLAGKNLTPHQATLRQLTQLTLHENGYRDRLVGFDQYLREAERLHQRLMVEIKTTPQDSPGMTRRFARWYGQRLFRDRDLVHSLDYRVVAQLRRQVPQLKVGYITPFNWVAPQSVPADFYSFQRLSVSDQFIAAAHQIHAPAYLWTPDSTAAMTRLWAIGADGQITNQLTRLRHTLNQRPANANWAIVANFALSYL